ncbi:hypothetical protein ACFXD5_04165 [Streptomyces sp. NPDC059385]|uniref:hypothetical protein n=1 Tax=Streptomyces sp. NPDC059385 TaxID=3346817 RepID=UPI0036961187
MTLLSDQADDIRALVAAADPGAVWAFGDADGVHAGSHDGQTVVDAGGLRAVLALWPVIGSLVEDGSLRLHTPIAAYGETDAPAGTTAHHLLTHPAGSADLTRLAERLTGSPLGELAATRIWGPLGMTATRFADGTLYASLADLVRFLCHLLAPEPVAQDEPAGQGEPAGQDERAGHDEPAGQDEPAGYDEAAAQAEPTGRAVPTHAWTTESLRIRTGELTPARGLLWHPAPHGVWTHPAPADDGPAAWISLRLHRWAILLPTAAGQRPLRSAFREAAFQRTGARALPGWDVR